MVYAFFLSLTFPPIAYLATYRFGGWCWGAAFAGFCIATQLELVSLRQLQNGDAYMIVPDTDFVPVLIIGAAILCGVWWLMSRSASRLPALLVTALFALGWAGWVVTKTPILILRIHPEMTIHALFTSEPNRWYIVSQMVGGWLVLISLGSTLLLTPITLVNIWRTRRDALRMDKTNTRG